MLNEDDRERISRGFSVYEHEWRFLAGYLGEPFLIDSCLVYWDGRTLNICALPLNGDDTVLGRSDLERIAARFAEVHEVELVHVWGSIAVPDALTVGNSVLGLTDQASVDSSFDGEHTIDLDDFSLGKLPEAAKSLRGVRNKGLTIAVKRVDQFAGSYYRIIEYWRQMHNIGAMASCAAATLPSYCRESHVVVVEASDQGRPCGFVVVAQPKADRAVRVLSFSLRSKGGRVGDALMFATIDYCMNAGVRTLHCGYAGSDSLSRFKEKWGARSTGPGYRQAMFATDPGWRARANEYRFYWAHRMMRQSMPSQSETITPNETGIAGIARQSVA
ncbi:hypothetical protein AB0O34_25335 [Sphaerisporangium sp. NPDC088356]|uniref:hypothetical protein n=1 Tax=Sphaerisporangium sp. NPDC088356 TaxID=3154871 RepID=UPI0034481742